MSSKNYKDYIELLKSREARQSFERTKAIIESRDNESAAYAAQGSQKRNWAIGIAALVLLALFVRMAINDSPKTNIATKKASVATNVIQSPQAIAQSSHSISKSSLHFAMTKMTNTTNNSSKDISSIEESTLVAMTNKTNNSSKDISATEESTLAPLVQLTTSVPPRPIIIEYNAQCDIPITLSQIAIPDTDDIPTNRFFVTVSGSLSQELNSIAANNRSSFDAFIGGGYIISAHLSIGLVGGRETFVMKQPYYSTNFTNEQFVHDGVSYPSLIGHIDTGSSPQTTQIYSIGANLRYTFIENSLSPYAEITGGGSTEGAIAGATFGLSVFRFDQLSLDAGAFIRALIPQTSSAISQLGASAQLRYDW